MRVSNFFFLLLATALFVATSAAKTEPGSGFSCLSWRLGVETHNIRDWKTVPKVCGDYVAKYILGKQYLEDSKAIADEAFRYAKSLDLAEDGKDIWVFDVDETVLSHVAFYAEHGFGTEPVDPISLLKFMIEAKSPALPESLKLYNKLLCLGIKVVFLTGRPEFMRTSTETNLRNVGYHTWEKLILRNISALRSSTIEYKSNARKELEESGYIIVGNMGDQWSDLLGVHPGNRTFKAPNPLYYVP